MRTSGGKAAPSSRWPKVPFRVFAPPTSDDGAKRPLIIALHGAGGDENMFMDAYGAGDSFAAGLTYGLAEGRSAEEAVALGARCGALVCSSGGSTCSTSMSGVMPLAWIEWPEGV